MGTITREAAKSTVAFWLNSKFFITVFANLHNWWPTTFLRTIPTHFVLLASKRFPASFANSSNRVLGSTFVRTNLIAIRGTFINSKMFVTNRAQLSNGFGLFAFKITSPTAKIFFTRTCWGKQATALLAGLLFGFNRRFMVTLSRTIFIVMRNLLNTCKRFIASITSITKWHNTIIPVVAESS